MSGIYNIPDIVRDDLLATMTNYKAFYTRPYVGETARGPLVGYAGTYDGSDGQKLNFVGETYVNFAKVEEHPLALSYFAKELGNKIRDEGLQAVSDFYFRSPTTEASLVLIGMPLAAMMFTAQVGLDIGCRTIYFQKQTVELAEGDKKEQTVLIEGRHRVAPGEKVILVEELVNNASTTGKAVRLVEDAGADVIAITCAFNRSYPFKNVYTAVDGRSIPIISVIEKSFPQYRQDDPKVAADVEAGNVVWNPKLEWPKLKAAMDQYG